MNDSLIRAPGIMRTVEGNLVDLRSMDEEHVEITDIAWGLGRTLRYGGHIKQDYYVAHHCIIMSYLVPERYALEALLHDAAETYIGDIIYPVKTLFPEIARFEDDLLMTIMDKYEVPCTFTLDDAGHRLYSKSPVIREADLKLLEHECFSLGRPGVYHSDVESAWLRAVTEHDVYWGDSKFAYLERFDMLTGSSHFKEDYMLSDDLVARWFPEDIPPDPEEVEQAVEEAVNAD